MITPALIRVPDAARAADEWGSSLVATAAMATVSVERESHRPAASHWGAVPGTNNWAALKAARDAAPEARLRIARMSSRLRCGIVDVVKVVAASSSKAAAVEAAITRIAKYVSDASAGVEAQVCIAARTVEMAEAAAKTLHRMACAVPMTRSWHQCLVDPAGSVGADIAEPGEGTAVYRELPDQTRQNKHDADAEQVPDAWIATASP